MKKPQIADSKPKVMAVKAGTFNWCACGESKKQPFCDGSHKGTGFEPLKVTIDKEATFNWCMCKQSGNKPFCDGTHSKI